MTTEEHVFGERKDLPFYHRFEEGSDVYEKYGPGDQYIKRFDNGYSTSVIRHATSYGGMKGLWEMALYYKDKQVYVEEIQGEWEDTVIGWLNEDDVLDIFEKVKELKPR